MNKTVIGRSILILFIGIVLNACTNTSSIIVSDLKVELLDNPIGIDRNEPQLSWKLTSEEKGKTQTAYQIVVASSFSAIDKGDWNRWNSGKVAVNQQSNIIYQGQALEPFGHVYWKVRIWDENDRPSEWSEVATWSVGPLSSEDWKANWISNKFAEVSGRREPFSQYDEKREFDGSDTSAVYLRSLFAPEIEIRKATAYVSGLGYYELFLNGKKIGDHVLDPVLTDYQQTVKYIAYDVTQMIIPGKQNSVAVILGNGFYNHTERDLFQMEKANWKTPPKLLCQIKIDYQDGSHEFVNSNENWKWSFGPIVFNSIRGGETVDIRKEMPGWNSTDFDDSNWKPVAIVPRPLGKLTYQYMPPMREVKSFDPEHFWSPREGVIVYDLGENITGYADLEVKGKEGQEIDIYFNEALMQDSSLNIKHSSGHTWGRFQHGKLILDGSGYNQFEPRFTYHGFRYVQLEGVQPGDVRAIKAHSVHTDLREAGTFECSNKRLNQLHTATKRTLLNSIHGMPGEEPTREKMGWTFDGGMVTMESYLMNYDAINVYRKYLDDLIQAQEPNGHIPPIVPTNGWGFLEKTKQGKDTTIVYDDPWWGGTIIYVADKLFEFTGDTSIIRDSYEAMKAYAVFVESTSQDHLVYWSLGDWLDLKQWSKGWGPGLTPIVQTSTAANYYHHERISTFAKMLGKKDDAAAYKEKAEAIKEKFNATFLQPSGWYSENSQTAQALPLFLGMVPNKKEELVFNRLLEAIEANDYHTSVGFIGVKPLLKYLSDHDKLDIAYRMVTQEESPGWLHFVKSERSTLGENLNAEGYGTSHHPFGSVIGFWLYYYLGGIQPINEHPGFEVFKLKPGMETELQWVNCSYKSIKGRIVSNWRKQGNEVLYSVEVPVNSKAQIELPYKASQIQIERQKLKDFQHVKVISDSSEKHSIFLLGSGKYEIRIKFREATG